MDDLSLDHPRCPDCQVLLRDIDGGMECPECGHLERVAVGPLPPSFDGPGIHGG